MALTRNLREMSPQSQWLLAVLLLVVAAQVVAMMMLAQSQVEKAAARDAMERTAVAPKSTPVPDDTTLADGVMTVGYATPR